MRASGHGFDLAMRVTVNGVETSRGRWSDIVHGFAELAARASADVTLRPGELLGSGHRRHGCLLEVRDQTLGRYLCPATRSCSPSSGSGRCVPRSSRDRPEAPARCDDSVVPRRQAVRVEPMEPADWPAVHRIYAEGIATATPRSSARRPTGTTSTARTGTTAGWSLASSRRVPRSAGSR